MPIRSFQQGETYNCLHLSVARITRCDGNHWLREVIEHHDSPMPGRGQAFQRRIWSNCQYLRSFRVCKILLALQTSALSAKRGSGHGKIGCSRSAVDSAKPTAKGRTCYVGSSEATTRGPALVLIQPSNIVVIMQLKYGLFKSALPVCCGALSNVCSGTALPFRQHRPAQHALRSLYKDLKTDGPQGTLHALRSLDLKHLLEHQVLYPFLHPSRPR